MLRSRFSWIVAGCLIAVVAVFMGGCSLDSLSPTGPDTSSEESQWSADELPAVSAKVLCEEGGTFEPVLLARPITGEKSCTRLISVRKGGKLVVRARGVKIELKFPPRSVPEDTPVTLTLLKSDALDFRITPHIEKLNRPARLQTKGQFILPDGEVGLFFDDSEEGWIQVSGASIRKRGKRVVLRSNLKMLLNHFSRYAWGSRRY